MPRPAAVAAVALLVLAATAAAAPTAKKVLVCGARQQGVGGEMAKVLNTTAGVQIADGMCCLVKGGGPGISASDDCAAACAAFTGCTSYQWCGYGSFNGTCGWPDATKPQAAKGDCLLGAGGWRQSGSSRDVGGWTVGTGCRAIDAPAVAAAPVAGDDEVVAPVLAPPVTPKATPKAAVVAPVAAADEPATPAAVPAAAKPAGWATTGAADTTKPLTDVVTPVRTPTPGAKPTIPPRAAAAKPAAHVDDGMTVDAAVPATPVRAPAPAPVAAVAPKKTAATAAAPAAAKKAAAAPAPAPAAAGGKRLAGTALELQPDLSSDECKALCDGDKACKGFSWCASPNGCGPYGARLCQPMTFTGPPRYVEGDGWTSGVKEATPAAAAAKSIEA